ncbi:MAG: hypothetical protein JWQ09_2515, partial [Segetibacter sp.]|nr:hypothetical protein [Segetibacter sp.]
MKKILLIMPAAVLLTYCSTFKSNRSAKVSSQSTVSHRLNLPDNSKAVDTLSTDTVIITGTQYMPIEGRSETGTRAELEGAWVLESMNGSVIPGKSNINVEITTKKIPEGTEIRHDSTTTTQVINGVTHTTTTVLVDRMGTSGNKITPPQGPNFHIPAKPSISFFGSN